MSFAFGYGYICNSFKQAAFANFGVNGSHASAAPQNHHKKEQKRLNDASRDYAFFTLEEMEDRIGRAQAHLSPSLMADCLHLAADLKQRLLTGASAEEKSLYQSMLSEYPLAQRFLANNASDIESLRRERHESRGALSTLFDVVRTPFHGHTHAQQPAAQNNQTAALRAIAA